MSIDSNHLVSRRFMLKASAACALASAAPRVFPLSSAAPVLAYIGSYSASMDGGAGNGKGIYLAEMHPESGELTDIRLVAEARNASWLSLDPSGRHLYSVNEVTDYVGGSGAVSAYAVHRPTGDLTLLNIVSSHGAGPAHLSVDRQGKYVFVANYFGGSIAVRPILASGALGSPAFLHQDIGSLGKKIATDAPAGSYAISGHDKPHAHMIHADPSNQFVLQTDLGQDRIYIYRLDSGTGKLSPSADMPFVSLPSGDGPRHFIFHPNGQWLYVLQEESSTLAFFHFDPHTGTLQAQQRLSTLPPGFAGTSFTSELAMTEDGRFLYAANRLHDTVALFAVAQNGRLSYIGETSVLGDYPRHIAISPNGQFLYASNQRSDDITVFRIDRTNGKLAFTGHYAAVGSPTCVVFLTL